MKKKKGNLDSCYGDGCKKRETCLRYYKRGKGSAPTLNTPKDPNCFFYIRQTTNQEIGGLFKYDL